MNTQGSVYRSHALRLLLIFWNDSHVEAQVRVTRLAQMLHQMNGKIFEEICNYTPGLSMVKVTVVCKGVGHTCEKDPLP